MELKVYRKSVYGNYLIYPACGKARLFLAMLGRKTFTTQDEAYLKQLGYSIQYVLDPSAN